MIKNKLKNISISISSGLTPLRSNEEFWLDGEIPWLKTEQLGEKYIYHTNEHITRNALNKTSIKINPENTLSIAMYGEGKTRGNLSILKSPMTTNQACCNVVIDPSKAHYEYVYYYLKTQYEEIRNLSSGVRKNLNSNDIKNYPIRLPTSLDIQFSIASVLKSLDNKIEINNRINAELETMAKTLYDYWFVQFDFPDANGKPYKTSGGKMVYNPILKRETPEGWIVTTIGEYAEVKKGNLITAKNANDGSVKVVAAGVAYSYMHSESNRKENTITISGSGANAGYINFWREPIFASDCITVRGKTDAETLLILHHLKFIQSHIISQASGSAQPHVYPSDIKILNYVVPSKSVIASFEKVIIPGNSKIANNVIQNQTLTKLRDWLLPMLINGQIKIS